MLKRLTAAVMLLAALGMAACDQTTSPERRELLGSWESEGLPGVVIRMTVAETARAVDGAGGWTDERGSAAFRVQGAIARDRTALYFDFSEREDVTFQGQFAGDDRINGFLFGGGFEGVPVSFVRDVTAD